MLRDELAALREHEVVAREGEDPEGVHGMRVAVRRMRVELWLAGLRENREELRWLAGVLSGVRDLDVLLLSKYADEVRPKLVRKRETLRRRMIRALDGVRYRRLMLGLEALPELECQGGLRRSRKRLEKAIECLEEESVGGWHEIRKAAKRLRFARELLGRKKDKKLDRLQAELGVLNDLAMFHRLLAEAKASEKLLAEIEKKSKRAMRRCRACLLAYRR